jgi:hypothetical protein
MAIAVVVAACTSKPSPPKSTPTPDQSLHAPSPSVLSTDPASEVQRAVTAYRGMWQAYSTALAVPDPDSPELARYATGNALKTLVDGVRKVKEQGLKGTGTITVSPTVTEVAPASAPTKVGIRDCFNDGDAHIVRASPGPPYSDKPGGRRLCLASVERQGDGSWKVTSFGLHEVGTCA